MRYLISSTALAIVLGASPLQATELTVITAGDQNMVDYVNNYLAPIFEKQNPGDTVRAVSATLFSAPMKAATKGDAGRL